MTDNLALRRERDLGAIVGDSYGLLFAHFGVLAAIVFPAVVTSLTFSLLFLAVEDEVLSLVIVVISIVINFVVFEFVSAAGVVFLDSFERRETFPSAESLDQAQRRLAVIGGAAIRSLLIVTALSATFFGIPWAVMRFVRWVFLSQVIMLEDKRGEEVLAASAELVKGFWWLTFGRLLVTILLLVTVPTLIVSGIANATLPVFIAIFIDAGLVFVTVPYGIISTTLMYFDLKTRKARHDNVSPDRFATP